MGDEITIHLTNLERAQDETHGFTVSTMNVHASVEPGKTVTVKFKADKEESIRTTARNSALHCTLKCRATC